MVFEQQTLPQIYQTAIDYIQILIEIVEKFGMMLLCLISSIEDISTVIGNCNIF